MKTLLTAAVLAVFGTISAQQTIGVKPFKSIAVGPDMNVTLVKSNENKVVVNGGDSDELNVSDSSGALSLNGDASVTIYFTEALENITIGPDTNFSCTAAIKSSNLNLTAGADAVVTLQVDVKNLQTTASSDAVVTLKGNAKNHMATYSSDAVLNATELETNNTNITLSSDAEAGITAKYVVNATVNSDAVLSIYGNPNEINQSTSDDGEIIVVK